MVHPSRGEWRWTRGRENILVADMSRLRDMKRGQTAVVVGQSGGGGPSKHVQLTSTDYVMLTTRTFFLSTYTTACGRLLHLTGITIKELHDTAIGTEELWRTSQDAHGAASAWGGGGLTPAGQQRRGGAS